MNFEFLQLQPELLGSDQWLGLLSGLLVAVVACIYAWQIFATRMSVNIATWGMILFMDLIGLVLAFNVGNPQPYMHVGWVFSDLLICAAALLNKGNWKWTKIETTSFFLCLAAVIIWLTTQSVWSVYAYLFACGIALLPQARFYWYDEGTARKSAWVWFTSSVAIILTLFAVPILTPTYTIVTFTLLTMYLTMAYLAFR